jgi:hypothetical protein
MVFMERLLNRKFERPELAPAYGTRNDIFRLMLKSQAQESGNLIAILLANFGCTVMAGKPRVHVSGALDHVMCRGIKGTRSSKNWQESYAKIQRC